jgi:hypothetical protein
MIFKIKLVTGENENIGVRLLVVNMNLPMKKMKMILHNIITQR